MPRPVQTLLYCATICACTKHRCLISVLCSPVPTVIVNKDAARRSSPKSTHTPCISPQYHHNNHHHLSSRTTVTTTITTSSSSNNNKKKQQDIRVMALHDPSCPTCAFLHSSYQSSKAKESSTHAARKQRRESHDQRSTPSAAPWPTIVITSINRHRSRRPRTPNRQANRIRIERPSPTLSSLLFPQL